MTRSEWKAAARARLGGGIFKDQWLMGVVFCLVVSAIVGAAGSILPGVGALVVTGGNVSVTNGGRTLSVGAHPGYPAGTYAGVYVTGADYALLTDGTDTLVNSGTATGTVRCVVVPSPSCPIELSPHVQTVPSDLSAMVKAHAE